MLHKINMFIVSTWSISDLVMGARVHFGRVKTEESQLIKKYLSRKSQE